MMIGEVVWTSYMKSKYQMAHYIPADLGKNKKKRLKGTMTKRKINSNHPVHQIVS